MFHHAVHIYIALQVVGFVKITFIVALGASEVYKINAVAPRFNDLGQLIIRPHAKGAGAETQPVRPVGYGLHEFREILPRAHYPGQPQDRVGWIVGMDDHFNPHAVCHGSYLFKEKNQVVPQGITVYMVDKNPESGLRINIIK